LIAAYFENYAQAFDLKSRIHFQTGVSSVERHDGSWRVVLDSGKQEQFDALVVANGHHWDARWPEPAFPGQFAGLELHSHEYVSPTEPYDLQGKRVVVVGMGNSAMDIACELGHPGAAARVFIAARRGAWILPKYAFGKPIDQTGAMPRFLPLRVRQALAGALYRIVVGRMSDYGLPEPDHPLGSAHPTISSDFLTRVGSGDVIPKQNLSELCGERVRFADGSEEAVDAIIYATGYKVSFPFFEPSFLSAKDNQLPLYLRIFHPDHENLFFIGLCQPLGAIMPLSEAQAKLVARYLSGGYALPTQAAMREHTERAERRMRARYVSSPRHTMQVDYDDYLAELARETRLGERRASKARALVY
ncbi:MAG TPA: NAD(P)-binding domain-containing protein, partial [Polyangiaceae bacterium]|nr:NAD(P)-binding domain-containing protein [Polyangiaceae bacterium]